MVCGRATAPPLDAQGHQPSSSLEPLLPPSPEPLLPGPCHLFSGDTAERNDRGRTSLSDLAGCGICLRETSLTWSTGRPWSRASQGPHPLPRTCSALRACRDLSRLNASVCLHHPLAVLSAHISGHVPHMEGWGLLFSRAQRPSSPGWGAQESWVPALALLLSL